MVKIIKAKKEKTRDKLTSKDIKKYYEITNKAFSIAMKHIACGREADAKDIILMVESYLSDSKFFEKKGDLINAFGAIYYAHGWIDCGVRLGIFNVKDDKLFTIR